MCFNYTEDGLSLYIDVGKKNEFGVNNSSLAQFTPSLEHLTQPTILAKLLWQAVLLPQD